MEAFSERLLREHQPAWQAMQQHPFVTDIEQDRLPTVVFNRYLVFEGNFVATAIAIFALGVSKAPGIQQQRWLIGVLNATWLIYRSRGLNRCCQRGRSIPLSTRMICPGYGAFATVCCGPPTRAAMSRL